MPTGRPDIFRCYACNRKYGGAGRIPNHLFVSVRRTGKTRDTPRRKRGKGAMKQQHEYTCDCGHSGWTSHFGILDRSLAE